MVFFFLGEGFSLASCWLWVQDGVSASGSGLALKRNYLLLLLLRVRALVNEHLCIFHGASDTYLRFWGSFWVVCGVMGKGTWDGAAAGHEGPD